MELFTLLATGAVLGLLGQSVRAAVGMKKLYVANKFDEFDWKILVMSLVIGTLAGALAILPLSASDIDTATWIAVLGAGYAGTDFIEGMFGVKG